jgi:hypothetical protein
MSERVERRIGGLLVLLGRLELLGLRFWLVLGSRNGRTLGRRRIRASDEVDFWCFSLSACTVKVTEVSASRLQTGIVIVVEGAHVKFYFW